MASRIGLIRKRVRVSSPKSISQVAGSGIRVSSRLWNKLLDESAVARAAKVAAGRQAPVAKRRKVSGQARRKRRLAFPRAK